MVDCAGYVNVGYDVTGMTPNVRYGTEVFDSYTLEGSVSGTVYVAVERTSGAVKWCFEHWGTEGNCRWLAPDAMDKVSSQLYRQYECEVKGLIE